MRWSLHPHFQQPELFDYVVANGIVPIGYSPLGSPSRPLRDRTPDDTVDMDDPVILQIAERRGITPGYGLYTVGDWTRADTNSVFGETFSIPRQSTCRCCGTAHRTTKCKRHCGNLIKTIRLIKGQVFLWKDGQTWEALWDIER